MLKLIILLILNEIICVVYNDFYLYLFQYHEHIDDMFKNPQKFNNHCIMPGPLNSFEKTRKVFLIFILI